MLSVSQHHNKKQKQKTKQTSNNNVTLVNIFVNIIKLKDAIKKHRLHWEQTQTKQNQKNTTQNTKMFNNMDDNDKPEMNPGDREESVVHVSYMTLTEPEKETKHHNNDYSNY